MALDGIKETPFHEHNGKDAPRLALRDMNHAGASFGQYDGVPESSVTSPTGGATIDSQARSSIDELITRLENMGLIETN